MNSTYICVSGISRSSTMHPVISIDAAHLKLAHTGTIFIYSGMTGNDEAYILAFGIHGGNEDYRTWNSFNRLFARACPSASSVEDGHSYSKFVFVSDRDKGLGKSLSENFPRNHATNCVHHIKQECENTDWSECRRNGIPNCYCFSTIQEETLLEQLITKSVGSYDYLEKLPMEQWHNMKWIMTQQLPPQHQLAPWYGVVTSNTNESINSMIDDSRSEGWTDLLEGILQKMMEKISENRQLHK